LPKARCPKGKGGGTGRQKGVGIREVRKRRAFTDDELCRLLKAVSPERRALYLTAVFTGLRKGELSSLIWDDVKLTSKSPHILARAATTKNDKDALIQLHGDVVEVLTAIQPPSVDSSAPVFTHIPRTINSETISNRPEFHIRIHKIAKLIFTPCAIPLQQISHVLAFISGRFKNSCGTAK